MHATLANYRVLLGAMKLSFLLNSSRSLVFAHLPLAIYKSFICVPPWQGWAWFSLKEKPNQTTLKLVSWFKI